MFERSGIMYSVEFTLHDGSTITVQDAGLNDARYGESAFMKFTRGETITCEDGTSVTTYIPFHAVIKAVVTTRIESEQVTDPMCVEP